MQTFIVGGAVRDLLNGVTPRDTDYVVVGSSVAEMLSRGFIQVGADFPVFLHPETHDEYALARTERKTGKGYNGFETKIEAVTLEEDLSRRDLTINAMAMNTLFELTDPFGGKKDLEAKVLRHVSEAFAEDPLRVLRVARFMARFGPEWTIAPETVQLMHDMVAAGTLDELSRERVWVELEKGLNEAHPVEMLKVLRDLKVLQRPAFAEYSGALANDDTALQQAVENEEETSIRFALAFPRQWTAQEARDSRIPKLVRDVSHCLALGRERGLEQFGTLTAQKKVELMHLLDCQRQGERTARVISAMAYVCPSQVHVFASALEAVKSLNQAQIIAGIKDTAEIRAKLMQARQEAVANAC